MKAPCILNVWEKSSAFVFDNSGELLKNQWVCEKKLPNTVYTYLVINLTPYSFILNEFHFIQNNFTTHFHQQLKK